MEDDVLNELIREADSEREEVNNEREETNNNETNANDGEQEQSTDNQQDVIPDEILPEDNATQDNDKEVEKEIEKDTDSVPDVKFESIKVQIDGGEISLDSVDDMRNYIKNNKDDKNNSELLLKQFDLTEDDINLLVNAKKGDKNALAKLAELSGIDLLDVDEDMAGEYKNENEVYKPTEVDRVAERILKNEDLASKFKETIASIPSRHEDFVAEIGQDPARLEVFAAHIQSGFADKVLPEAIKKTTLEGGSLMENYTKIGERILTEQNRKVGKTQQNTRTKANKKNENGDYDTSKGKVTGNDIFSMSDEEFARGDWKNG